MNELDGFVVVAAALRRCTMGGWNDRGSQIGDEQGRFAIRREVLEARHDFSSRKKRRGGGQRQSSIPMKKSVTRKMGKLTGEEFRCCCIERSVEFRGELGMLFAMGLKFSEAERDRFLDLLGKVKVVARHLREERVDEMEASEVVGRRGTSTHC